MLYLSVEEHSDLESLQRNRISNVAFAIQSAGEVVVLAVMIGILKGLKPDESTENNTKAFSVLIAFAGGVWGELFLFYKVPSMMLTAICSSLCSALVHSREAATWFSTPTWNLTSFSRYQASLRSTGPVYETQADLSVLDLLLHHG